MDFVDQALARRLEAAEEMPQVHYARLYQKLWPEIGAAVEAICGGHMILAGLNSPIGRTVGMGFDGTTTAGDLDRMEEFYRSHAVPSQIDVCPFTDPLLSNCSRNAATRWQNFLKPVWDRGHETTGRGVSAAHLLHPVQWLSASNQLSN